MVIPPLKTAEYMRFQAEASEPLPHTQLQSSEKFCQRVNTKEQNGAIIFVAVITILRMLVITLEGRPIIASKFSQEGCVARAGVVLAMCQLPLAQHGLLSSFLRFKNTNHKT